MAVSQQPASQFIVPERLYPVLNLISGLIILLIGVILTATALRVRGLPSI